MRTRWIALGLAIGLLGIASPALGEHVPRELEVQDATVPEPVAPLGEPARVVLDVRVPCQDDEQAIVTTQATPIQPPSFVRVQSNSVENRSAPACHDVHDTLAVGLPLDFSLTQQAPAFQQTTLEFQVQVTKDHDNGTTTQLGPTQANVMLTPDYFNRYNVRMDEKIAEAGPDESIAFPVTIENYSNGPTQFTFELANEQAIADGFEPVVPSKIVLESNVSGTTNTSGTVMLHVFTPFHNGYVSEIGAIKLDIHSAYAPEPSINGSTSQVSVLAKTNGFYVAGPGLASVVATLAGAGVLARRRG